MKCPRCGWRFGGITKELAADARKEYPNAFKAWTAADDRQLHQLVTDQTDLLAIAQTLGRQPTAVKRRIDLLFANTKKPDAPVSPVSGSIEQSWKAHEAEQLPPDGR